MIDLSQLDVSSPASYVVAFVIPALDAIIPVLPSESAVVALGVATARHADPRVVVLVLLAALGAFAGDNLAYLLGRRLGPRSERRLFAGAQGQRRREWAERTLERYGAGLIIVCRFIPGGRTAVTVTCGLIGFRRRTFIWATACAAVIWASYAFLIGRLGGRIFADRPLVGLLLALGLAVVIGAVIEAVRRLRPWRLIAGGGRRRPGAHPPAAEAGPGTGDDRACQPGDRACQPGDRACQPGDRACQPGDRACQPGDRAC
jgi:membrane protein DedA with SNARE-associated domain